MKPLLITIALILQISVLYSQKIKFTSVSQNEYKGTGDDLTLTRKAKDIIELTLNIQESYLIIYNVETKKSLKLINLKGLEDGKYFSAVNELNNHLYFIKSASSTKEKALLLYEGSKLTEYKIYKVTEL